LFRYYDVAVLIHHTADGLDWDSVVQRAVQWGLMIPLQRALAQLEELWPETVPAAVARQLAKLQPTGVERWIDKRAGEPRGGRISNTLASFATMPGLMRRVRFLLSQGDAAQSGLHAPALLPAAPWLLASGLLAPGRTGIAAFAAFRWFLISFSVMTRRAC
jgi:hypothetical protein